MIGASLLNTITESLYDNPIVVFREYVQNSADSLRACRNEETKNKQMIRIWRRNKDLFFLDNGKGIPQHEFVTKMTDLGNSDKRKEMNIGYKGIGRLSGLPYCDKILFVSFTSYSKKQMEVFELNGAEYKLLRQQGFNDKSYEEIMNAIGTYEDLSLSRKEEILSDISEYSYLFEESDTGFLVQLIQCSNVLLNVIEKPDFFEELEWLLPVAFDDSILFCESVEEFRMLGEPQVLSFNGNEKQTQIIPTESFDIAFDNHKLTRPFKYDDLRDYTCIKDLKYGKCVVTFSVTKLDIIRGNSLTGIKIYLDNVLLCDESELIPMLAKFNVISNKSVNDLIQSCKSIGALLYITDRISISANARRNFIEVTDEASFEFLRLISEFVRNIYEARYAMSKYQSYLKKKIEETETDATRKEKEKEKLKQRAQEALKVLGDYKCPDLSEEVVQNSRKDEKEFIRKRILRYITDKIREYMYQVVELDSNDPVDSFLNWLLQNR